MPKRKIRPDFPLGSISTDTLRTDDLALAALDAISRLVAYGYAGYRESAAIRRELQGVINSPLDADLDGDESEVLSDAHKFIDEHCPPYVHYDAHEGDGADIGFWVSWESLEEDRQTGELPDCDKLPKGYKGLCVSVSDHDNVELLQTNPRGFYGYSVWSIV